MQRATDEMADILEQLLHACMVISLDERISTWLGDNDPQALIQVRRAIESAGRMRNVGGPTISNAVNRQVAFKAVDERFASITDLTFLEQAEETAIIAAIMDLTGTLMLRGRERLSQRLGAELQRLVNDYHIAAAVTDSTHRKGK